MEGNSRPIRFGVFEADLRTGELRKGGLRIKLTGQPFQVLAMLLERPGDVVTREELQKRLWPADTFVDFDHSLNTAINKIRESLGDSAENPRFVETLPRRGYRFVAPVDSAPSTSALEEPAALGAIRRPPLLLRGRWTLWMGLVSAVVALATLAFLLSRSSSPPKVLSYTQITNDGRAKALFPPFSVFPVFPVLARDGSHLYFSEWLGGGYSLAEVAATGGETALISAPSPFAQVADINLKQPELLVLGFAIYKPELDAPLWIVPVPAGTRHRLGDALGHDGAWSPDGEKIVYTHGSDLYVAKSDGTESRKLVAVGGIPLWPRWSNDGGRLRFTIQNPPMSMSCSLWEVSADGSDLRPLLPGWNQPPAECCGNWTPDGRYFVFQSSRGDRTDLWAIREKQGWLGKARREPVQLTTGPLSFWSSVPSVDGKRLFAIGEQRRGALVRYDAKSQQFVPYLGGISAQDVDFSKDGAWVTYVAYPEGTLWRSKVDGSEKLQLTLPPMHPFLPRWSPDGKWIAFVAALPGKPVKIYLISPDGGSPQQVLPGERNEGDPSWSPDGNSLAFAPKWWLEKDVAVHLINLKTRRVSTLPSSAGLFSARWSPDGRYIAATNADSKNLLLFDFGSQKWVELADHVAYPNWSHDGNYIYFKRLRVQEPGIYRVRIRDRKLELITSVSVQRLTWGIVGNWTGLAPDDSSLVLRDVGTQEIYALDWQAP